MRVCFFPFTDLSTFTWSYASFKSDFNCRACSYFLSLLSIFSHSANGNWIALGVALRVIYILKCYLHFSNLWIFTEALKLVFQRRCIITIILSTKFFHSWNALFSSRPLYPNKPFLISIQPDFLIVTEPYIRNKHHCSPT